MSEQLIHIKFRDRSGNTGEFAVSELLSIDGKAWTSEEDRRDLVERMSHLEGRFEQVEKLVGQLFLPVSSEE